MNIKINHIRTIFNNIIKFKYIKKPPIKEKNIPTYSYGKFIRENPKATRSERRYALKQFLDSTR